MLSPEEKKGLGVTSISASLTLRPGKENLLATSTATTDRFQKLSLEIDNDTENHLLSIFS
jgi:hypothetical protein